MKKLLSEFKAFVNKGNALSLAIGVILVSSFMKMYNKLIDYEPEMDEYHQITINEYMNDLKLVRKKESQE